MPKTTIQISHQLSWKWLRPANWLCKKSGVSNPDKDSADPNLMVFEETLVAIKRRILLLTVNPEAPSTKRPKVDFEEAVCKGVVKKSTLQCHIMFCINDKQQ